MKNALVSSVLSVLCLLTALPLSAAEGAIPIWEPTTITESGSYFLTRDIVAPMNATAILIEADNVVLDLKGHVIRNESFNSGTCIRYNGSGRLTIRDGYVGPAQTGLYSGTGGSIRIENIEFPHPTWYSIEVGGASAFDLVSSVVRCGNRCIMVSAETAHIIGNSIVGLDAGLELVVTGVHSGLVVRDNSMNCGSENCSIIGDGGIIANNTFVNHGGYPGLVLQGDKHVFVENVVERDFSILGSRNRIAGNIFPYGSVVVSGSTNLLEDNQVHNASGIGLSFEASSSDNVYRNNVLRGSDGVTDNGTNNTDAGGNVF